MATYKPQKITRKSARAREMIASIYHIPLKEIRGDRNSILKMYVTLEELGFEWVADAQEWLNPAAKDPEKATVFSFVIGSATHSAEEAALTVIEGLEHLGYKLQSAQVVMDMSHPEETIVRVEVIK